MRLVQCLYTTERIRLFEFSVPVCNQQRMLSKLSIRIDSEVGE
jgi:hypothetical protein